MHVSRPGRSRSRAVAVLATLATAAALLIAPSPATAASGAIGVHAAPPPNPTDAQLQATANLKASLANLVGSLSATVATLQTQLDQLQGKAELAEQKYAFALEKLANAKAAAVTARQNADAAQRSVVAAQREFVAYAQASYMDGEVGGTTGTLLSADDPNVLLQQGALQQYQAAHQINAIGTLRRATVLKSNADAASRKAVKDQTSAANAASDAKAAADAAVATKKDQTAQMQRNQAAAQTRLNTTRNQLLTLTGQRAKYDAYVAEQKRLAELRRQAELKRQRAAAAAAAARARAAARNHHGNNGGGGGNGSGGSTVGQPIGGSWTPARGQAAANRALDWLGEIYIWAGGDRSGPTVGSCTDPVSPCGTKGFDCSGLAIYAWGQYMGMDHYAATQYSQAGSYHPSTSNLMPGDLMFWSYDGSRSGIHHVAIYIGNGDIVEAPDSGLHVRIVPWRSKGTVYYGATRPLT